MAKTQIEKTIEKQQREQKKLAEQEARRQRASMIVSGQPLIGDMRIMDSSSEEILKIILENYDGNEQRRVHSSSNMIPEAYRYSLQLQFEKLKMYGVISDSSFWITDVWEVTLTIDGIEYFNKKEAAYEAQHRIEQRVMHESKQYDVFISHANKDKSDYVDSLYMAIRKLGVNIFYDSEELSWGDNWKQVILDSTEKSEFAIIVISENFFGREWTERELDEFLKRQNTSGQKIVLPLLHNISLDMLKAQYPTLGDIQIISTERYTKEEIAILFAKELIKRLKN